MWPSSSTPASRHSPPRAGDRQRHARALPRVGAVLPVADQQERRRGWSAPRRPPAGSGCRRRTTPSIAPMNASRVAKKRAGGSVGRHVVARVQHDQRADRRDQQREQPSEAVHAQAEVDRRAARAARRAARGRPGRRGRARRRGRSRRVPRRPRSTPQPAAGAHRPPPPAPTRSGERAAARRAWRQVATGQGSALRPLRPGARTSRCRPTASVITVNGTTNQSIVAESSGRFS